MVSIKFWVTFSNANICTFICVLFYSVVSSSQLNDLSSEDALRDIDNKIKKHSAELRTLQEEQKRFENQIQNEIDISREKKGTLTQDVKTKKKTIETNQREIEKVQAEIAEVNKFNFPS